MESDVLYRASWPYGLRLFFLFMLLYGITASGDLTGDSETRWAVAVSWLDTGTPDLPPDTTLLYAVGRDGKAYSFYGPSQSLCYVPFLMAGRILAALSGSPRIDPNQVGQFLASLLFFPACGALAVVMMYYVAREASGDPRAARRLALIFGLATMHWQHTVNTHEESQVAVCTLASLWAVLLAWKTGAFKYRLLALAAMGAALTFRVSSVVISAPLGLVALVCDLHAAPSWADRGRRAAAWLSAVLIGLGPFVLFVAWYNHLRFGSAFETGYTLAHQQALAGMGLFDTPLLTGLTGTFFSPGKSVFLYNPVLLAAIPGIAILWRTQRRLAAAIALPVAATVLFHSMYTFWAGDLAWGPRFLASAMGLCTLALLPWCGQLKDQVGSMTRPTRLPWCRQSKLPRPVIALIVVSVVIQLASIVYSFGLEFFQDRRHGTIPDGYVWRPAESQLFCRFRNLALHALGRPDYESIPPAVENVVTCQRFTTPEQVRRMHVVNIFPFKAYAATRSRAVFLALFGVWLLAIGTFGVLFNSTVLRATASTESKMSGR